MFDYRNMKTSRAITNNNVICPVKGCTHSVTRMKKKGLNLDSNKELLSEYMCPEHRIYISPTTFEYESEDMNFLWNDPDDKKLLSDIKKVKRESRMARENSEDAMTWNIFRYLERNKFKMIYSDEIKFNGNYLDLFVEYKYTGGDGGTYDTIYWSHSQNQNDKDNSWRLLNEARKEFGEELNRSSEPDIILNGDKELIFIEAKLGSGNNTVPTNIKDTKKYLTGGNNWFDKVFNGSYYDIAVNAKKYELMRFWLLGTWMADKMNKEFILVNLVRRGQEEDIEEKFGRFIHQNPNQHFIRDEWEEIYEFVLDFYDKLEIAPEALILTEYMKNKTLGYKDGRLVKAFQLDEASV